MENGGGKQHTEVEIRLDMLRSQCERRRGGIKERRGGSLEETDVRAAMFTKEERREGMEGVRYKGRGVGVESRPDARKRKKAQCSRTASAAQCCGPTRKES